MCLHDDNDDNYEKEQLLAACLKDSDDVAKVPKAAVN